MTAEIIGRSEEKKYLYERLKSQNSEFIAVYGRRRVGKTVLIKHAISVVDLNSIDVTGLKDGNLRSQLDIFTRAFIKTFKPIFEISPPTSWVQAFEMLSKGIDQLLQNKNFVIFFDELPWLATPKSGLLQALDHFWNTDWVNRSNLKLIICGSAASWIIDNIINAKGGLHNRLTARILLKPFSISETVEFLESRSIKMNRNQILDLYLVMGGIPFYLKSVEKGYSAVQNVNELCFKSNGVLFGEFDRLYSSLFHDSDSYVEIIRVIAKKSEGIDLKTLEKTLKLSSSGGTLSKRLSELEAAGFIISFVPYGREKKGIYYRIIDEYTLFYQRWIEPVANRVKLSGSKSNYWQSKSKTPNWRIWVGYAFEAFCYKHIDQIASAMKIDSGFEVGTWRYIPKSKEEKGVQIDLLIDRDDDVINIIEIKYSQKPFRISKQYATQLGDKIDVFRERLNIKKDIHLTFVTVSGLLQNNYADYLVSNEVKLDDFFD